MTNLARTPEQIGAVIRRARKNLGWNQAQLAEKCGLRQGTISLVENGNPAARIDTLLKILAALDLEFQILPRSKAVAADIEDIF